MSKHSLTLANLWLKAVDEESEKRIEEQSSEEIKDKPFKGIIVTRIRPDAESPERTRHIYGAFFTDSQHGVGPGRTSIVTKIIPAGEESVEVYNVETLNSKYKVLYIK